MSAFDRLRIPVALLVAIALTGCSHFVVLHDPLTANEHNDLGVVYEANGQPALAAREYRKALSLAPDNSHARVNLGNLDAAAGRWPQAEKTYRRALRDGPTDTDAMNNLAIALLRQHRRLDEARGLARRAIAAGTAQDSLYRATLTELDGAR